MHASSTTHDAAPARHGPRPRRRPAALLLALGLALVLAGVARCRPGQGRPAAPEQPPPADLRRLASPELSLDQGLTLAVLLSLDCQHCLETARLLAGADTESLGLRVVFLLLGEPRGVDAFFDQVGARVPYALISPADYAEFAGSDPPTLYLLNHGAVAARWSGTGFSLEALRDAAARCQGRLP